METRKLFRHLVERIEHQSAVWIVVAIVAISEFTAIAGTVVSGDEFGLYDKSIIHYLHALVQPGLTSAVLLITWFGSAAGITLVSLIMVLAFLAAGKARKALFVFMSGVGSAILVNAAKEYILRPRPMLIAPIVVEPGYSFPSGHSTQSACLYGAILVLAWSYCKPLWLRLVVCFLLLAFVALVGLSRIYLGVHYPSDVLGGFFLGLFWLSICVLIFKPSIGVRSAGSKQVNTNVSQTGS